MLRAADPEDLGVLAPLWHAGWLDGHAGHVPEEVYAYRRLEDFRRRLVPRLPTTTVAVVDGEVSGFVTVVDDELEQLYVAPAARGTGTATALLDHGERSIAEDHEVAWLAVVAGNARARHFYERQGWTPGPEFDNVTDDVTIPALRYEKRVR